MRLIKFKKYLVSSLLLALHFICFAAYGSEARSDDLRIIVISDLNDAYGSTTYGRHVDEALAFIKDQKPDLVICAGDMVAGQSLKLSHQQLKEMWQAFDRHIYQPLKNSNISYAFTFGNHDGPNSSRFKHEREIARHFWEVRRPDLQFVDGSRFPDFYSFVFKNVFFASIDASTARVDQQQRSWLKSQLGSRAAKQARLRVIVGHLPLYAVAEGRNRPGDVLHDADALADMFDELGVDYYISGHHHAYRFSQRKGLKMLAAGALGGGPRKLLGSALPPVKTLSKLQLEAGANDFRIATYDVTSQFKLIDVADPVKSAE